MCGSDADFRVREMQIHGQVRCYAYPYVYLRAGRARRQKKAPVKGPKVCEEKRSNLTGTNLNEE